MDKDKYIAAIEIGSSKISGAVGRVRGSAPDRLEVLAVEVEHATDSVSHGLIQNVEDVGNRVGRIIGKLEKRINSDSTRRRIKRLFVGVEGRSLRNIKVEISRNLPDDTEITEMILSDMREDARNYNIDASLEVRDVIPNSYVVNKSETRNPVGICGNNITARYNLIVCRPLLHRHLTRVIRDKAGLGIAEFVITPIALANLVLSADEKRLGCMLVDMGAETTTVSLYKDNRLVYLAVLPMGSRNITNDITSLNVLEDKAEEMKTTSGSAMLSENQSNLNLSGVRMSDVANLVAARSEELVANIVEQISYAGMNDKQLPGGIVTAGGGFHLKSLPELLKESSGLSVRRATLPAYVSLEDTKASAYDCLQLVAILSAGMTGTAPECIEEELISELPVNGTYVPEKDPGHNEKEEGLKRKPKPGPSKMRGILSGIGKKFTGIFAPGPDDDDDDTDLN